MKKTMSGRLSNPLGMDEAIAKGLEGICKEEHVKGATFLFNSQTALGTATGYRVIINDFRDYCLSEDDLDFNNFGTKEVIGFIMAVAIKKNSKAYMAKVKPAISKLETTLNRPAEKSCFTPMVDAIISGGKRVTAEIAPTIKKMDPVPKELVLRLLQKEVWEKVDHIPDISLKKFRIIFKWVVEISTLCRFDDFVQLRARDFTPTADRNSIEIFFPRSKNDQFHKGQSKYLDRCRGQIWNPVEIAAIYFRRFGFQMDGKDDSFIHCRLRQTKNGLEPDARYTLTYTAAAAESKALLKENGYGDIRYGEGSSAKRAGVSSAIHKGVAIDTVQQCGGWRTNSMPLHYLQNSETHKVNIAKEMKFADE